MMEMRDLLLIGVDLNMEVGNTCLIILNFNFKVVYLIDIDSCLAGFIFGAI